MSASLLGLDWGSVYNKPNFDDLYAPVGHTHADKANLAGGNSFTGNQIVDGNIQASEVHLWNGNARLRFDPNSTAYSSGGWDFDQFDLRKVTAIDLYDYPLAATRNLRADNDNLLFNGSQMATRGANTFVGNQTVTGNTIAVNPLPAYPNASVKLEGNPVALSTSAQAGIGFYDYASSARRGGIALNNSSQLQIEASQSAGTGSVIRLMPSTSSVQILTATGTDGNLTTGNLTAGVGAQATPSINFATATTTGIYLPTTSSVGVTIAGTAALLAFSSLIRVPGTSVVGWASGLAHSTNVDAGFSRIAGSTIGLGNGSAGDVSGALNLTRINIGDTGSFLTRSGARLILANGNTSWPMSLVTANSAVRLSNGLGDVDLVNINSSTLALYTPTTSTASQNASAPSGTLANLAIGNLVASGDIASSNGKLNLRPTVSTSPGPVYLFDTIDNLNNGSHTIASFRANGTERVGIATGQFTISTTTAINSLVTQTFSNSSAAFRISNAAGPAISFGGIAAGNVALAYSGTTLQVRLGDNSAAGNLSAAAITASGALTGNNVAATSIGSSFGAALFDATTTINARPNLASRMAFVIRLQASQTADAMQVQDSAGGVLSSIGPTGSVRASEIYINTDTRIQRTAAGDRTHAVYYAAGTAWQDTYREQATAGGAAISFYGVAPTARQSIPTNPTTAEIATALANLGLVLLV